MPKAIISALIPTMVAVAVFSLPLLEIYTLFYLTPVLSGLDSMYDIDPFFHLYSLIIPALWGILVSLITFASSRHYIMPREHLLLVSVPGVVLTILSTFSGRYGFGPSTVFLVALVTLPTIGVIRAKGESYASQRNGNL